MRRRSLLVVATALFCTLWLSSPVAAQATNRDLIDGLNFQLLYVALPLSLFVLIILVYAAVTFHDNDDPKPTTEDPALEITWTAATAIILLFVGISGYSVLVSPYVSPAQPTDFAGDEAEQGLESLPDTDDEEVRVLAYRWGWEATYPDANVTTRDEIVVPADEDVTIWLTSDDVIHSLFVSELGVKQDAFPDEYTRIRTHVYEPGEYDATCTEFCGAGHSRMRATVVALEPEEYERWLEENADSENATAPSVS